MKSNGISEFYLFTDTSCNYPFYEHLGLTRCCEKKQLIDVKGEKGDMTFFIYEYQIKQENWNLAERINISQLLVDAFPHLNGGFATDNIVTITPNERSADKWILQTEYNI